MRARASVRTRVKVRGVTRAHVQRGCVEVAPRRREGGAAQHAVVQHEHRACTRRTRRTRHARTHARVRAVERGYAGGGHFDQSVGAALPAKADEGTRAERRTKPCLDAGAILRSRQTSYVESNIGTDRAALFLKRFLTRTA
eukprot:6208575-Pleurochrysis_carterae.AAC.1